jgi:hypothetical protein
MESYLFEIVLEGGLDGILVGVGSVGQKQGLIVGLYCGKVLID